MNRKISVLSKGMVIFAILFYYIYFAGYTCSGAGGSTSTIINMHYERGVRFYKQGEYDKAISELESILYIDANYKKAKKYLAAAIKRKNKKIVNQLYKEASDYYKQQEYQRALETYQKVVEVMPDDGYSLYKIELLRAKIEKLDKLKQSRRHKERTRELERLTKERIEKEKLLKKVEALEQACREKERRKKEAEMKKYAKREAKLKEEERKSDIARDLDDVEDLLFEEEKVSLPSITVFSKDTKKDISKSKETSEKEKMKKIKSLYKLGKEYYSEGDYRRAIAIFQQVIDLEDNHRHYY